MSFSRYFRYSFSRYTRKRFFENRSVKSPVIYKLFSSNILIKTYCSIVIGAVLIAYIASVFSFFPYSVDEMDLESIMLPPEWGKHLLGTDYLGRDILSRLILGTQSYLLPGLLAISISIGIGAMLGAMTAFSEKKVKLLVRFSTSLLETIPRLVLLLLIIAIFKANIYYIMGVIGICNIPTIANIVSRKVDVLKNKSFIDAAIANGTRKSSILFKHILWFNCRTLLIGQAALGMAEAVLMESSLSYLGFGVQEPIPSWGNMVQSGTNYLLQGNFWPSTIPALLIMLLLSALYLFAEMLIRQIDHR